MHAPPPPPPPTLEVVIAGKGTGTIMSVPAGIECGERCEIAFPKGTKVKLVAVLGEGSTFRGWHGGTTGPGEVASLIAGLGEASSLLGCRANHDDALECELEFSESARVIAEFGRIPESVEARFVPLPPNERVAMNLPDEKKRRQPDKKPPKLRTPKEPKATKVVELKLPPRKPPPKATPKPPPKQDRSLNMTSVEVADNKEVDKAPDDARFLSDKNRDVAEETRARDTNLEKSSPGTAVVSERSDIKSDKIGAKEDVIAQTEKHAPSDLEARRNHVAHTGNHDHAAGSRAGAGGQDGNEGQNGAPKNPGLLSMRGIRGRGMPGGPLTDEPSARAGKPGKRGKRGVKTQLSFEDYKRIVGDDVAKEEVRVGRRRVSKKRGRFARKQAAVRAALENFVTDVKPGNQTALKTRAHPFAVYIARMHRRIHELWGFGFLEDLDDKPSTHPMNDWSLQTIIEVSINPNGEVHKTTIARPSGLLEFDVAAIDTILTAGPYEQPPKQIRSVDDRVYMHWVFRRDWQQCGTFNVRPYILATAPSGDSSKRDDGSELVKRVRNRKRTSTRSPTKDPALAHTRGPKDPRANHTAQLWVVGFTKRNISKLKKVSAVPFRSADTIVATSSSELTDVYRNILTETGGSRFRGFKLLSPAGYRQRVGPLPKGLADKTELVLMVVTLSKDRFTLALRQTASGTYRVVGFHR